MNSAINSTTINSAIPQCSYVTADGSYVSAKVFYAIKAAAMRQRIGRYAALQYAIKNGSTARMFRIACQLTAIMQATHRERIAREQAAELAAIRERAISLQVSAYLKTSHDL